MNSKKCKGCEWYGKPYWSINNPCDNCPRDNIQIITRWADPTIEQLKQENKRLKILVDIYENKIIVLKELLKEKAEKIRELEGDDNE